ncbi:hypothetical protein, partial [Acinetobacter baumannii]|uniref:hypothetical protein n=1 Tax=Acinetobacter baumannii TaxID=470 RepID=UPI00148B8F3D
NPHPPPRLYFHSDRPRREGGFDDRPKRSFGGEDRPRRAVREEHFNQESRGERRRKFDR